MSQPLNEYKQVGYISACEMTRLYVKHGIRSFKEMSEAFRDSRRPLIEEAMNRTAIERARRAGA